MSDGLFDLYSDDCPICGHRVTEGVCRWCSPLHDTDPARMARRTDPSTSKRAAQKARYRTGTHKALIMHAHGRHPAGLTDEEAAPASGLTYHQAERRCCDLRNDGMLRILIDDEGREVERPGTSGSDMRVSVLTDLGFATLRTMKENDDSAPAPHHDPAPPATPHICVWTWANDGDGHVCRECGERRDYDGPEGTAAPIATECDVCGQHNGQHDKHCPERPIKCDTPGCRNFVTRDIDAGLCTPCADELDV